MEGLINTLSAGTTASFTAKLLRRPARYDEDVVSVAVNKILPAVMQWLDDNGSKESEVRADLISAHADDGYEFTRNLKRRHLWSCDATLVDILGDFDLCSAQREMERKWVAAYRCYPFHLPGNKITFKGHTATIVKTDDCGYYHVFCAALGHVKEGLGTHSEIVPWETIDGKVNMLGLTITGPLLEDTCNPK